MPWTKLVSGRFCQRKISSQTLLENGITFPSKHLENMFLFWFCFMYSLETFLFKERGKSAPSVCPKSFLLNWDPLMDPLLLPLHWKDQYFLLWRLFSDCFLTRDRNKSGMSILGALTLSSGQCLTCIVCATHTGRTFLGTVLLSELFWTADIS